jgi:hypothetical protein
MFNLGGATLVLGTLMVLGTACAGRLGGATTPGPVATSVSGGATTSIERDPDVPQLPFPDNPDPHACGIPSSFGSSTVWVNGVSGPGRGADNVALR